MTHRVTHELPEHLADWQLPPGWSWGTEGQFWACRVSHLLGLIAVLGLLWMTVGR